jgi:hypothetical protein
VFAVQLTGYPALMFNLGLANAAQREIIQSYCDNATQSITAGDYSAAFLAWDAMLVEAIHWGWWWFFLWAST